MRKPNKYHLDLLNIAKERKGTLLSKAYISAKTKLRWRCQEGHIWLANPNAIKNGAWCPKCGRQRAAEKRRDSIENMKALARSRKGYCLSRNFQDNITKLKWKCQYGHTWEAAPSHIKTGTWCPQCGKQRTSDALKDTIENMHSIAKKNYGQCLSKIYHGSHSNLKWKCSEGHIWRASPTSIKSGSWCRVCAFKRNADRQRDSIKVMNLLAKKNVGKCLSKTYTRNNIPLRWQCEKGHVWDARPANIKMGGWCPYCRGRKVWGDPIHELRKLAAAKGGELLSKRYLDTQSPLKWKCSEGHTWQASASAIKFGRWCARCYGNVRKTISEARMAAKERGGQCLSKEYERAKAKLKWKCAEGHVWEASWESAIQYTWCPQCNASSSYGERVFRDVLEQIFKTKFPRKRPQWLTTLDGKRLELDGYSDELGIAFEYHGPQHDKHVDFFHNGKTDLASRKYYDAEKRKICRKNGIKLIEIPYTSSFSEVKILKNLIKAGCQSAGVSLPKKFNTAKLSITGPFNSHRLNEIKAICKKNHGSLISASYMGSNSPVKVKCKNGHIWEALPSRLRVGYWCPYCAKRRVWQPLKTYQALAHSRGGKLLSKSYESSMDKLTWKCKAGHTWDATHTHIKLGTWCPYCSKVRIWGDPYEELKRIAKKRKGLLLSKKYFSAKTQLRWKCHLGHSWSATPDKVKRGSWCPTCAGKPRR